MMCWSGSWKRVIVGYLVVMDIVLCRAPYPTTVSFIVHSEHHSTSTGARGSEGQLSESWQAPGARPLTLASFSDSSRSDGLRFEV